MPATIHKMNRPDYRDRLINRWNKLWDHWPSMIVFALFIYWIILFVGGCGGSSPIDPNYTHGTNSFHR